MEIKKLLRAKDFINGRAITWSKRSYREENPNSVCVFNACIVTKKEGQAWFGDLDLTKDADTLREVAFNVEDTLYILSESDAMNLKDNSVEDMIAQATWDTTKETPIK